MRTRKERKKHTKMWEREKARLAKGSMLLKMKWSTERLKVNEANKEKEKKNTEEEKEEETEPVTRPVEYISKIYLKTERKSTIRHIGCLCFSAS